jgi:hypothetical protein
MERVGFFLAGFASGWAVRTTVDSSRALAVNLVATFYKAVDGASRVVGMEREHLEDLLAEARAKYEMDRARESRRGQATQPTGVPRQDRAA